MGTVIFRIIRKDFKWNQKLKKVSKIKKKIMKTRGIEVIKI